MTAVPKFLSLKQVLLIHQDQLARYGGAPGIRDIDLLKSALGIPPATYGGEFLHTDIFEMAAGYLFHIVKNHPFVDGNKRTGAVAALVFLSLNDIEIEAEEDEFEEMVLSVAQGRADKAAVTEFFRKNHFLRELT